MRDSRLSGKVRAIILFVLAALSIPAAVTRRKPGMNHIGFLPERKEAGL